MDRIELLLTDGRPGSLRCVFEKQDIIPPLDCFCHMHNTLLTNGGRAGRWQSCHTAPMSVSIKHPAVKKMSFCSIQYSSAAGCSPWTGALFGKATCSSLLCVTPFWPTGDFRTGNVDKLDMVLPVQLAYPLVG